MNRYSFSQPKRALKSFYGERFDRPIGCKPASHFASGSVKPTVWMVLVFCLGCGDSNKEQLDLVGKSNVSAKKTAIQKTSKDIKGLADVLATDLLQDLYFRYKRDRWHLQTGDAHVNVDKLVQSGLDLVLAGLPLGPGRSPKATLKAAIRGTEELIAKGGKRVVLSPSFKAAKKAIKRGKIAIMLLVEGADAFVSDPSSIKEFKSKGVLAVGLVAGRGNGFAEAAMFPRERGGLTRKGVEFLAHLRDAKIAVDLTHASSNTFWDTLAAQAGMVIVSHTACRALMDHPRNLSDLQILALARFGGLMGLIFNPVFLAKGGNASLEDVAAHVLHIKALGALHILALGTDFDGIEPPRGLSHVGYLPRLWDALLEQGLSDAEIKGIMGENSTRFFEELHREFGAVSHTEEDMVRPLSIDCDSVTGEVFGMPKTACDGVVLSAGATLSPTSKQRIRLKDVSSTPGILEIFGEPNARWQVEGQNLAGKILFHRFVQLSSDGQGQMGLLKERHLTRLFLSPTKRSTLNEAVVWGRPPALTQ